MPLLTTLIQRYMPANVQAHPPNPPHPACFPPAASATISSWALAATISISCIAPHPVYASIPLTSSSRQEQQARALRQLGVAVPRAAPDPSTQPAKQSVRDEVDAIIAITNDATSAIDRGEWQLALDDYSLIVGRYPDLALAERARVPRALLLYQVGRVEDALLALEDEEVALVGSAEVHAALAAVLYAERPAQRERAEQQWAVATAFDGRWADAEWVRSERKWPPRMVTALQRFLTLT